MRDTLLGNSVAIVGYHFYLCEIQIFVEQVP